MPRFVILHHRVPSSYESNNGPRKTHWDLMLEHDGQLQTWALSDEPAFDRDIPALLLPDHRIDYLEYEGPISNNRGEVTRVDQGTYEWLSKIDPMEFRLEGRRFCGIGCISKIGQSNSSADEYSEFIFRLQSE